MFSRIWKHGGEQRARRKQEAGGEIKRHHPFCAPGTSSTTRSSSWLPAALCRVLLQERQPHKRLSSSQLAWPHHRPSPRTGIPPTQTKGHVQHPFTSVNWFWVSGEICSYNNFTPKIKATINRLPGYLINGRHHLILIKSQSVNSMYWEAYQLPLVWHMHHMVHFPTGKPAL